MATNDDANNQGGAAPFAGWTSKEKLTYRETDVPIYRQNCREVYVALQPPQAAPYLVAPHSLEIQKIVDFFIPQIPKIEELRNDMQKRFAKSSYGKCAYRTGDVAYVMGRPFMLRVYPLKTGGGKVKGARGRATAKYGVDTNVSLLTLFVVHSKNFDEAKVAFNSFAQSVIAKNATVMAKQFNERLRPEKAMPPIRLRAMRDKFASYDAGALWISTDIVPYPHECLAYVIWKALATDSDLTDIELSEQLARDIPSWRDAANTLSTRAKPYSNQ